MRNLSLCVALVLGLSLPAAAQTPDRWFIAVNGGVQSSQSSVSDGFTFERNLETATVDVRYPAKSGPLVDGGLGVRLWNVLGVGVAVSHVTFDGTADIDASIPHPLQFTQPRAITGSTGGVTRTETAVHVQALVTFPLSRSLRLQLSVGPSRIQVEQEFVNEVQYDESYPYDTATFKAAATRRSKGSAVGFNAGADIAWMFSRHIGVGGLIRFASGRVDLDTAGTAQARVDAGGLQGGAGVRIGF